MGVSAAESEKCPRCEVLRAPLPAGGWCSTCGYNPKHEAELQHLLEFLADSSLCPGCHRQREEFLRGLPEGQSRACIIADLRRQLEEAKAKIRLGKQVADNYMKLNAEFVEQGALVTALQAEVERLLTALGHSVIAIDDWLHQYASEECNAEDVERTWARIRENGGTLTYIAQVQQRNREARPGRAALAQPESQQKDEPDPSGD